MKKILLTIVTVLVVGTGLVFSQENNKKEDDLKRHEVKINGLLLAFSTTFDVAYEYVANSSYGFGASVLINAFNRDFPQEKFSVTPFYRAYFFSKKDYGANGFFVEAFLKLTSIRKGMLYVENPNYSYEENINLNKDKNIFRSALGISIGKKWINKNGFIVEIFGGIGRTLNDDKDEISFLGRGGVTIGKRF